MNLFLPVVSAGMRKMLISRPVNLRRNSIEFVMTRLVLGSIGSFAENMALIVQLSGMTMFLAESANPRMVYMRYTGTLSFSLVVVLNSTSLIWLLLIMQIRSGPLLISVFHGMEM